jgi:Transposase IS4
MVAFKGRSKDTIKLKNKPINIGYKLWCISDHGYIWSWLFYSKVDDVETLEKGQKTRWLYVVENGVKSVLLAPTHALILRLTGQLLK